jgi:hypothetical protein
VVVAPPLSTWEMLVHTPGVKPSRGVVVIFYTLLELVCYCFILNFGIFVGLHELGLKFSLILLVQFCSSGCTDLIKSAGSFSLFLWKNLHKVGSLKVLV